MRHLLPGVRLVACATALSAVGLVASGASGAVSHRAAEHASSSARTAKAPKAVQVYATYYGWYDNTPPGCATAYSGCAGGTGTYAHPITFASDRHELPVGTIVYYPTVEKYFVMGDDCQECDQDWAGKGPDGGPHLYHVDLWIGGKGGNEFDVINCEDALTQGMPDGRPLLTPFILNPPPDEPVSTEPLFDTRTNHCFGGATALTTYGRYANRSSGDCLEGPTGASPSQTPAAAGPCNTGSREDLAFDGAFFSEDRLYLQTEGTRPGAHLDFATCNGNDREQWEINPNGTIAWIQYTYCIADERGTIEMSKCTSAGTDLWTFTAERAT